MISLEYFLIGNNICPSIQIDQRKNMTKVDRKIGSIKKNAQKKTNKQQDMRMETDDGWHQLVQQPLHYFNILKNLREHNSNRFLLKQSFFFISFSSSQKARHLILNWKENRSTGLRIQKKKKKKICLKKNFHFISFHLPAEDDTTQKRINI